MSFPRDFTTSQNSATVGDQVFKHTAFESDISDSKPINISYMFAYQESTMKEAWDNAGFCPDLKDDQPERSGNMW